MRHGPVIHRFLDPGDALGEVLFGLIMTLTFTVGARFFMGSEEFDRNELIVGALGCNVAWGIIDGVLFVLGNLFFRGQRARFYRSLRDAPDDASALAAVESEFTLEDEPVHLPPDDRARLYQTIMTIGRHTAPARIRVTRQDMVGAFLVFLLVAFSAVPGTIPLLAIEDETVAIRASNAVQVVLLFIGGYRWGGYADVAPWKVGSAVALLGIGMGVLAVLLGG